MVLTRIFTLIAIAGVLLFSCSESTSEDATDISGEEVFNTNCVTCHGADGTLCFGGAPDLTKSVMPHAERVALINSGKGVMISYKGLLSDAEIDAVAEYSAGFYK